MSISATSKSSAAPVRLDSLKIGDVFRHAGFDVLSRTAEHRVKAHLPDKELVEVECFCDPGITRCFTADWQVFKINKEEL